MVSTLLKAVAAAALGGLMFAASADAQTTRLIVKLQPDGAKSALTTKARIEKAAGTSIQHLRTMAIGADVVAVAGDASTVERTVANLAAHPDVAFVQVDHRRRPDTLRTAMATAFFCPTSTTSFLPRVTPV